MKKSTNRFLFIASVLALTVGAQFAFAQNSFQNNLLKMEVAPSTSGGVKMTLYTNKPYTEAVVVNKKENNEYVIFMPETSNSMTANPVLNSVADALKGVTIKTQQYEGAAKGYTKIIVRASKPIEITTQVKTAINENLLSQNDYEELMQQVTKKAQTQNKPKSDTTKPKTAQAPMVKTYQPKATKAKAQTVAKQATQKTTTKIATSPIKQEQALEKKVEKPIEKPIQQEAVQQEAKEQQVGATAPEKTVIIQPVQESSQATPTQEKDQQAALATSGQGQKTDFINSFLPKLKSKLKTLLSIVKTNLTIFAGAVAAIFLILLVGARKMSKNLNKQRELFESQLKDAPQAPIDYSEKITEDMNWREKFQAYTEAGQVETPTEETESVYDNQALDDLFTLSEDSSEEIIADENENIILQDQQEFEQEESKNTHKPFALDEFATEQEEDISLEDFFNQDDEDITQENEVEESQIFENIYEEPQEQIEQVFDNVLPFKQKAVSEPSEELIQSEFRIDEEKGFYLVDFEDTSALVGHIEDEIFVLKRFDEKVQDKLQARLNEKKASSSSYMTRVGDFKGLVEVTADKMNLLIEL